MGYLDSLGDGWGVMCGTRLLAKEWADRLTPTLAMVWKEPNQGWFSATSACLSALLTAGEYQQILDLLARPGCVDIWHYRVYGVEALRQMGKLEDALAMARRRNLNDPATQMDLLCEELLIDMGRVEEAYREFGLLLRRAGTYKATFSALCRRYPDKEPRQMLRDLVGAYGEPGSWFTAAVGLGELELAAEIAPDAREPKTLTRAARSHLNKHPAFSFQVALAALEAIDMGAGYEITGGDVLAAYDVVKKSAQMSGQQVALETWLAAVRKRSEVSFVKRVLGNFRVL